MIALRPVCLCLACCKCEWCGVNRIWCSLYRNGFFVQSYICSQLRPFRAILGSIPKLRGKKENNLWKLTNRATFKSKVKVVCISVHTEVCYSFLLTSLCCMFAWVKSNWTVKKTWAPEATFNFWCTEPYPKALVAFSPVPWGLKSLFAYMQKSWNILEEQGVLKDCLFAWPFCILWSQKQKAGSLALPLAQATWKRIATRTKMF